MEQKSKRQKQLSFTTTPEKVQVPDNKVKTTKYDRYLPHISEGRWYGELTRAKKHGNVYDWKTILINVIVNYMGIDNVKPDILSFLEELSAIITQYSHCKGQKFPELQIQLLLKQLYQSIRFKSQKHLGDMDMFYTNKQGYNIQNKPAILPLVPQSSTLLVMPSIPKCYPQLSTRSYTPIYQENPLNIQKRNIIEQQILPINIQSFGNADIVQVQKGDQYDVLFQDLFE